MDTLNRWSPLDEAVTLRDAVSRLFEDSVVAPQRQRSDTFAMATDIYEHEHAYVLEATLPGLQPEDLEVTFHNNVLTLQGEIRPKQQSEEVRTHRSERRYGRFSRSFSLPMAVDHDQIEAHLENGVLTLNLPKAEAAKPRKIAIQTSQKMVAVGQ